MNTNRKGPYAQSTVEDGQEESLDELDKKYLQQKRMVS